jgi:hypothetical protein
MGHSRCETSYGTLGVEISYCGDTTIARVGPEFTPAEDWFFGISRRRSEDKYDVEVAEHLAFGRALQALANSHLRQGNGLVKHHDDMKTRGHNPKPTKKATKELQAFKKAAEKKVKSSGRG